MDFLIRDYGFSYEDFKKILKDGNLPLDLDPKTARAMVNPHLFPVEINSAQYEMLIRIPGIGKRTAEEIIKRRRKKKLRTLEDLKGIRNLSKILPYITLDGKRIYS